MKRARPSSGKSQFWFKSIHFVNVSVTFFFLTSLGADGSAHQMGGGSGLSGADAHHPRCGRVSSAWATAAAATWEGLGQGAKLRGRVGRSGCEDIAAKTEVEAAFQAWRKLVAKVNEQFCRKLEPEEVDTLVQTPRRDDPAAGDRLDPSRKS